MRRVGVATRRHKAPFLPDRVWRISFHRSGERAGVRDRTLPKVRRVDYSADEYIAAIAGMSAAEQGVYWLICSLIYSSGHPIPEEDQRLAALCGCHWRTRKTIIQKLIESGKVVSKDGQLAVKRCSEALQDAFKRISSASHGGKKGNEIRWHSDHQPIKSEIANYQLSTINVCPPSEDSPPIIPPASEKKSNGRGSRLPADWQPSAELWAFAVECGLNPDDTFAEFRDYWRGVAGAKGVKLDWEATARNHCRHQRDRQPSSRPAHRGNGVFALV